MKRLAMAASTLTHIRLPEPDLEKVKCYLKQFQGGRVTLTKDEESGIAYMFLDHPEKKNCLSGKMMVEINELITELENWKSGKGLILHSETDVFCSSALKQMARTLLQDPNKANWVSFLMQDSARRFKNLPLVSVALVQGKVIAGGAEVMLWADFRLMTKDVEVIYSHAKLGCSLGWGGGLPLKALVGNALALEFMLTSRPIFAEEALSVGLANGIVNTDTRLEEAKRWLGKLLDADTDVVRGQKTMILAENLSAERENFVSLSGNATQLRVFGSSDSVGSLFP